MRKKISDALAARKLRGLALKCAGTPRGVGKSRVGGNPDLPAEIAWPTAPRGRKVLPLSFVAQIALKDLPHSGPLPKDGLLSFFMLDYVRMSKEAGWSKKYLGLRDATRVIYSEKGVKLAPREPPPELPSTHVGKASSVKFRAVETWPQVEGVVIGGFGSKSGVSLTKEEWDEWAQNAPRSPSCAMLGHPAGCEFPIGADPTSRLLLSLDVKESGLSWDFFGRNGYLFFFAPEKAIEARDWTAAAHKEW